jgi:hypothetical protein
VAIGVPRSQRFPFTAPRQIIADERIEKILDGGGVSVSNAKSS